MIFFTSSTTWVLEEASRSLPPLSWSTPDLSKVRSGGPGAARSWSRRAVATGGCGGWGSRCSGAGNSQDGEEGECGGALGHLWCSRTVIKIGTARIDLWVGGP